MKYTVFPTIDLQEVPQDEIDKNPNLKQMPGWMN